MAKVTRAIVRCYLRSTKWCEDCPAHTAYIDEADGWNLTITTAGILKIKKGTDERWYPPGHWLCLWMQ